MYRRPSNTASRGALAARALRHAAWLGHPSTLPPSLATHPSAESPPRVRIRTLSPPDTVENRTDRRGCVSIALIRLVRRVKVDVPLRLWWPAIFSIELFLASGCSFPHWGHPDGRALNCYIKCSTRILHMLTSFWYCYRTQKCVCLVIYDATRKWWFDFVVYVRGKCRFTEYFGKSENDKESKFTKLHSTVNKTWFYIILVEPSNVLAGFSRRNYIASRQ